MQNIILGLGSNRGDSEAVLYGAIAELRTVLGGLRQASLYITKPMHKPDQPDFLNTACAGSYQGSFFELLDRIHQIEAMFGRDRTKEERWGPRSLDIDILFAGKTVVKDSILEIPHPRLVERRFALEPLLELEADPVHPVLGVSLRSILSTLPDQGVIKLPQRLE